MHAIWSDMATKHTYDIKQTNLVCQRMKRSLETLKNLQHDIRTELSLDGRNDQPLHTTQLVPTLPFQSNSQELVYITTDKLTIINIITQSLYCITNIKPFGSQKLTDLSGISQKFSSSRIRCIVLISSRIPSSGPTKPN